MTDTQQQVPSIDHVWTEEPNAIKLRTDKQLLRMGEVKTYEKSESPVDSPLATLLLTIDGILSVDIETYGIKVLLDEDSDWDQLGKIAEQIFKDFLASGAPTMTMQQDESSKKKFKFGFRQVEGRPREEQMEIVRELFEKEINPSVAAHGGHFTLIDIQDNRIFVELGGGCQGCGMAKVTLKQGVETRLREVLPEMEALIDTTDHASGNNPYYKPE